MTPLVTRQRLLEILGEDDELVTLLIEHGIIVETHGGFAPRQVERAIVSRTLLRELDVNAEGVEIIVRLRERLLATHRQVARLLEELRRQAH